MTPFPPWHAEVVADSIGESDRIITCVACIPNAIHQEILRHRAFSFSVESQRAVPAREFRQRLKNDGPYIPVFLARSPSMQGQKGVLSKAEHVIAQDAWLTSYETACQMHQLLEERVHKSIINRMLAPYAWTRMVITGAEWAWQHFFRLRCSPDADVAIQAVASRLRRAIAQSHPVRSCHLPFIPEDIRCQIVRTGQYLVLAMISAAACASISYGGIRVKSPRDAIRMAIDLIAHQHLSPFEHQAQVCFSCDVHPGNLHSSEWMTFRNAIDDPPAELRRPQQNSRQRETDHDPQHQQRTMIPPLADHFIQDALDYEFYALERMFYQRLNSDVPMSDASTSILPYWWSATEAMKVNSDEVIQAYDDIDARLPDGTQLQVKNGHWTICYSPEKGSEGEKR